MQTEKNCGVGVKRSGGKTSMEETEAKEVKVIKLF